MKNRLLPLAGLLLLLAAPHAEAALGSCTQDPLAKEILTFAANPVSDHYTLKVLQRIDAGIQNVAGISGEDPTDEYRDEWLPRISTALNELINSETNIGAEREALRDQTACLAIDAMLLESAIEEVRCELNKAYADGRSGALPALLDLLGFTNDRHRTLLEAARDPLVEDVTWHRIYRFDDPEKLGAEGCLAITEESRGVPVCVSMNPAECRQKNGTPYLSAYGCVQNGHQNNPESDAPDDTSMLCPFHTDYLPPMAGGYWEDENEDEDEDESGSEEGRVATSFGCDAKTLLAYSAFGSIAAEAEALKEFLETRDEFITSLEGLSGAPDGDQFGSTVSTAWEHRSLHGCFSQILEDPSLEKILPETTLLTGPASNLLYQLGLARWELFGPFSFERDELTVARQLAESRIRNVSGRSSLPASQSGATLDISSLYDLFGTVIRREADVVIQRRSSRQAMEESIVLAKLVDAPVRLAKRLAPIRESTVELSRLASELDFGMRKFARGLAWFLLRSCVGRPGAVELSGVLKIVLTDACFPYASGEFLGNPLTHLVCRGAAGL
jgi:hypothetical protein